MALLLGWIRFGAEWLVQLPFDHHDYTRSGAASVAEYLQRGGWHEFWGTTVFAWSLMLVIVALTATAGAAFSRLQARVAPKVP